MPYINTGEKKMSKKLKLRYQLIISVFKGKNREDIKVRFNNKEKVHYCEMLGALKVAELQILAQKLGLLFKNKSLINNKKNI